MIYRFAIAVLIAIAAVNPTAAELKIEGPPSLRVGDMAFYRLSGAKLGDPFDYFSADGSMVVLFDIASSPVGVLNGTKAGVATLIGVKYDAESKKIERVLLTVPIGDPPGPEPTPTPNPPTPEPSGPLGKQMASWLAPLKGKVTKAILGELASNYEGIAAQAVAVQGTMTKDGFVAATQTENVRTLGPQLALEMRDPFFVPLAKYMNGKKLAVDDETGHAALWREVSAALNEVAKSW